jgi:hypothetical protein
VTKMDKRANEVWERLKDPEYYTRPPEVKLRSAFADACAQYEELYGTEHGDSLYEALPWYRRTKGKGRGRGK